MAENTYKSNTFKKPEKEKKSRSSKSTSKFSFAFLKDPRFRLAIGFSLIIISLYLFVSFVSYLFTGKADQSIILSLQDSGVVESGRETENWLGLYGAFTSNYLI
jgi:S-DNA-T family DNA segregation ATPase FtsK/SpoIIIE